MSKRVRGLRLALLCLNLRVRELERKAARDVIGIPGCVCFGDLKYFWILFLEVSGLSTQITFNSLPPDNRAPLKRKQPDSIASPTSVHWVGKRALC